jgi:mannose-6-phosphate isomerase-like protein (cupin superfamily)
MTVPTRIVRAEEREGVPTAAGGDIYADLATGEHTNGSYYLVHAIVPAGGGPPAHIHTREEEAFFVIRGDVTFFVEDESVKASAGTFLNVPRGTKHQFLNESSEDAEMIFWFAPAGIEGMFAEMTADPEHFVDIGAKYGVTYFLD